MKYLLFLTWILYIIWWIYFISTLNDNKNELNILNIEKSIVKIIAKDELISYRDNPNWIIEEYKKSWIWAWFFINNKWVIQTVNHIIENEKIEYKVIYDNNEYKANIISRDELNDKAIILINLDNKYYLKRWEINENEIYSFWINPENLEILYNTWIIINKKSKLENKSNLLEISNILIPGFSGWPILNNLWEVIWINYANSNWKNYWIKF